jgi:hypothetical protein
MYDLMASRLGRGHGLFQVTSHCHFFALYLIASEKVRARAQMLEKRFNEEIGDPPLLSRIASLYISTKIKKNRETPHPEMVSDPPPRWAYYHTFDDRVWVRKGRRAKDPVPYKDRRSMALSFARVLRA